MVNCNSGRSGIGAHGDLFLISFGAPARFLRRPHANLCNTSHDKAAQHNASHPISTSTSPITCPRRASHHLKPPPHRNLHNHKDGRHSPIPSLPPPQPPPLHLPPNLDTYPKCRSRIHHHLSRVRGQRRHHEPEEPPKQESQGHATDAYPLPHAAPKDA